MSHHNSQRSQNSLKQRLNLQSNPYIVKYISTREFTTDQEKQESHLKSQIIIERTKRKSAQTKLKMKLISQNGISSQNNVNFVKMSHSKSYFGRQHQKSQKGSKSDNFLKKALQNLSISSFKKFSATNRDRGQNQDDSGLQSKFNFQKKKKRLFKQKQLNSLYNSYIKNIKKMETTTAQQQQRKSASFSGQNKITRSTEHQMPRFTTQLTSNSHYIERKKQKINEKTTNKSSNTTQHLQQPQNNTSIHSFLHQTNLNTSNLNNHEKSIINSHQQQDQHNEQNLIKKLHDQLRKKDIQIILLKDQHKKQMKYLKISLQKKYEKMFKDINKELNELQEKSLDTFNQKNMQIQQFEKYKQESEYKIQELDMLNVFYKEKIKLQNEENQLLQDKNDKLKKQLIDLQNKVRVLEFNEQEYQICLKENELDRLQQMQMGVLDYQQDQQEYKGQRVQEVQKRQQQYFRMRE